MITDAAEWRMLDDGAARAVASSIAHRVGGTLLGVRAHEFAGRTGRTALFDVRGQRFSLVPGGEVAVGYDGGRFVATPEQSASYATSAAESGLRLDLQEFVDSMTSAPRTVVLPPLLVSVAAVEAGAVAVPPDHPDIVRLIADARAAQPSTTPAPGYQIEWSSEARVILGADWTVRSAWLLDCPLYEEEVDRLAAIGQRLLTPDEWEHACGGGAPTLFRWGDTYPAGGDPYSAAEGPHLLPNIFGLEIGQDPYQDERTADPGVVCGGDGGSAVHGGGGEFVSWLTVATAFRDTEYAEWLRDTDDVDHLHVRPAIPLA
ncbi:hypothetical protein F0L68_02115 [Solihabitans fulvus]|uniref:Formylglycine-generating enzyme, required for sulfatase activity, contains SUMF1/FGE domain n=1 Tax=Solihabitans fulvus TaxID=1892852 RepID=A0A5B2XUS1_9PSEU|nr:hypothetical protein [Solihabitans fulvus]KAA2266554.1 hypothetical protein F0L68_02115 [Solihabitans fulvus]